LGRGEFAEHPGAPEQSRTGGEWTPAKKDYLARRLRGLTLKKITMPAIRHKAEEADGWASRQGREFVKQRAAAPPKKGAANKGSRLAGKLNRTASVQIALRLPEPDLIQARELATRKGVGYQTLLKMLVHEGLRREARRA
jgi:hypothetical protein